MCGAAVRILRCSSARARLGTSRNFWSHSCCLLKSRKPKTWLGGTSAGCWANAVKTKTDRTTTNRARFNISSVLLLVYFLWVYFFLVLLAAEVKTRKLTL